MQRISLTRWPEGKTHALTFSYDDGQRHDIRLIEILDAYGLKGTFHLNSGNLERENCVQRDELGTIYANHEISTHTVNHPVLTQQPDAQVLDEFLEDRKQLEAASGRVIRGMSYPFGSYDARVIDIARAAGLAYGRTVRSHGGYGLPEDWLAWHPTCHDRGATLEKGAEFLEPARWGMMKLMYVWGHSFEFPQQNRWESFDAFCALMGQHPNAIWAATNIDVVEYVTAQRRLIFSAERTLVSNPSSIPVWITVNDTTLEVPAGTVDMATG